MLTRHAGATWELPFRPMHTHAEMRVGGVRSVTVATVKPPGKMLLHTSMQEHGGCGALLYRYCI